LTHEIKFQVVNFGEKIESGNFPIPWLHQDPDLKSSKTTYIISGGTASAALKCGEHVPTYALSEKLLQEDGKLWIKYAILFVKLVKDDYNTL
jgi:hypothetical protein